MRYVLTFLLLWGSIDTYVFGQERKEATLQVRLDSLIVAHELPGATLAFYDGTNLISLSGGFADKEAEIPMPVGGQMLLGSTGKTFVAAILLNLVGEGLKELDEKLLSYFPEEDWMKELPEAEKLSIRMLLNHTSGMPRYIFQEEFLTLIREKPQTPFTPRERLTYVLNKAPIHPAGEGWSYSDTNYLLLGMLIEKVTGNSFYEMLQKNILDKYNLTHTYPSTQPELPGLVQGHIGSNNFFQLPPKVVKDGKYAMNPQFEWTGGGLVSNVDDLAKWMYLLHSGEIIPRSMYQEMIKPVDFKTGQPAETGYGFANFTWKQGDSFSYGHSGMMPGYVTQIEYFPDKSYAMALQVNSDQGRKLSLHALLLELEAAVK